MPRSEIYYAQLVEEESTATVMAGLREVIERKGAVLRAVQRSGQPFLADAEGGGKVDLPSADASGAGAARVGVQMIPAYSPQARGRRERNFGTWQGRLPQELRLRHRARVEAANGFLREVTSRSSIAGSRSRPQQRGNAFTPCPHPRPGPDFLAAIRAQR